MGLPERLGRRHRAASGVTGLPSLLGSGTLTPPVPGLQLTASRLRCTRGTVDGGLAAAARLRLLEIGKWEKEISVWNVLLPAYIC